MPSQGSTAKYAWYKELSRYHWFVLSVAIMGWMFDTMAQQLFNLARKPAIRELLGPGATAGVVDQQAAWVTSVFLVGWALGGILFGILGDRIGRAKTMMLTILCYTLFTGLSVFSTSVFDFGMYRFLCGFGVGGQFAVGVALVAEVVPDRARPYALGMVQAFSAVGNMLAALTGIVLGQMVRSGTIASSWRYMFLAGALPAPLAIVVFKKLKEPDQWWKSRAEKKRMGSFADLLGEPRWRRNSIVGMLLAFAGVVGLWGIGFFSYDLFRPVLEASFKAQGISGTELAGKTDIWIGVTSLLQNLGGFFGVYGYTYLSQYLNRKKAFAVSFVAAMGMTAYTFWNLKSIGDMLWMIPMMGFCQLALFGGYAIYLPELFPTRLRSTGTSFCYNVGRMVAAAGPFTLGLLTRNVFKGYPEPLRYAGVTMCLVFLVGLAALPFAPETKGKPLPE
ncbi:Major facilitator superfamily MFS_1 [Candidatus Sulfopaludibacter sp. SbA3]|nr:Major facilitator superfamily MFS_1 [Candidatus Sulfopaludibacter sp. SbA3]